MISWPDVKLISQTNTPIYGHTLTCDDIPGPDPATSQPRGQDEIPLGMVVVVPVKVDTPSSRIS